MLNKKQKMIATAAMCALVLIASVINFGMMQHNSTMDSQIQSASGQVQETITSETLTSMDLTFVAEYKKQRVKTRQEQTQNLEIILQDEKTDEGTRRAAQEQLMELVAHSELEMTIETILEAKGFYGVAVAVQSDIINILVDAELLEDVQVAQILDIAMREGQVEAKNVKIVTTSGKYNLK